MSEPVSNQEEQKIAFKTFLESTPPGDSASIADLGYSVTRNGGVRVGASLHTPDIYLYCDDELCKGMRYFKTSKEVALLFDQLQEVFLPYSCRNCGKGWKSFALRLFLNRTDEAKFGGALKYGEFPPYGPHTPARLITLIGAQRDLFLKGRRSENQGLGIGAFGYYRRVIEDQKNRIFDEIIKVSQTIGGDPEFIKELGAAKSETQFTKGVDAIKHAIPQALLVNGHNPLTLLHSALSEGLHDKSDEECLDLARSIRVVMAELADRMAQALKDEVELNQAVTHLLRRKAKPALPAST